VARFGVYLRFASDEDCETVVQRLRTLAPADEADVHEVAGGGAQLVIEGAQSPVAALVRAQMLIHAACVGTSVSPASVRRSLHP
jgi:hypothetical protein